MFYIERLRNTLRRFVKDERGASAIEYALIAALIALVIIGAATLLGEEIESVFESIQEALSNAGS